MAAVSCWGNDGRTGRLRRHLERPNEDANMSTPLELDPIPVTEHPTVLVVDDSLMDQRRAGRLIEKLVGARVVYANNGAQALAVLERERPDIVVTDLQMPEMDGLELVQ